MLKSDVSDYDLIRGYLNGNHDMFNQLYERYRKPLYSYLNKMMPGQPATVDDIFQKTWVKAVNNIAKYQEDSSFFAWIIRIGRNSAIDHFRKTSREVVVEINEQSVPESSELPWRRMGNEELEQAIRAAVAELPEDQREVFLLRQDDVPFKEIADIQGTSLNTVLGRMHYATRRLRNLLTEWK